MKKKMEYIKGFFKPTVDAAGALAELGISNPAGFEKAHEGLWGSITVPSGVFKYTPGNPGVPGRLDLNPEVKSMRASFEPVRVH